MNIKRSVIVGLFALPFTLLFIGCLLTSCKKETASTTVGSNVAILINNLSPDAYPVHFYANNVIQNPLNTTTTLATAQTYALYNYNVPSAYFSLNSADTLLQLRSTRTADSTLVRVPDTIKLKSNTRYSLFLTGLLADRSLKPIFTADDTTALPALGKAKLRYVNGTLRITYNGGTTGYDVYANGTLIYKNIKSLRITKYVELPAGTYDFKFVYTGTDVTVSSNLILDLPNITVLDSHLYTLYSCGITGRTDSAAVTASIITNK